MLIFKQPKHLTVLITVILILILLHQDCAEFLALLATKMGKLQKGGVPDRNKAARILLGDWNSGKIKYFTHPPEQNPQSNLGAEIVQTFAAEFSLDTLDAKMDLDTLPVVMPSESFQV